MNCPLGVCRAVHTLKDSTNRFRPLTRNRFPLTLSGSFPPVAKFPRVKKEVSPPLRSVTAQPRSLATDDRLNEPLALGSNPDTLCVYLDIEFVSLAAFEQFLIKSAGFKTSIWLKLSSTCSVHYIQFRTVEDAINAQASLQQKWPDSQTLLRRGPLHSHVLEIRPWDWHRAIPIPSLTHEELLHHIHAVRDPVLFSDCLSMYKVTYRHEVAIQLRFRTIQSASSALPILDGRFAIDLPPYTVAYLGGPVPTSAEVLLSSEEVTRGINGRVIRSVENLSYIHQRLTKIFGSAGRIFSNGERFWDPNGDVVRVGLPRPSEGSKANHGFPKNDMDELTEALLAEPPVIDMRGSKPSWSGQGWQKTTYNQENRIAFLKFDSPENARRTCEAINRNYRIWRGSTTWSTSDLEDNIARVVNVVDFDHIVTSISRENLIRR
ncbi:hypothetical protein BS47DRAFT_1344427 [Hydnum rufescens UP504]|uniref:Uncharacterized protein n=1 Tax=Hydnum rufescens UP504 TaxID=1448309 RepID=A0A9P6AWS3_9AGAM|nr:hypothetical protein BS47DRAFT_1344427 [Hydnum rufescens UP504]